MKRTQICDMKAGETVNFRGFVEKVRDQKFMQFVVLRDITGRIQMTVEKEKLPEVAAVISTLMTDSIISVEGKVVEAPMVKLGGRELIPAKIEVLSHAEVSPITDDTSIAQRLDYRWIDLRRDKATLTMQVNACLLAAMREFLVKENFLEISSPKLLGAASESGSEVFEVKYFDQKAYLAQSPQFYKQMAMAAGLERIFEIGPVFRAENSNTNRHVTEFTGLDIEFSYIDNYEDVMVMEERMLTYALQTLKDKLGKQIQEVFGFEVVVPKLPFPRIDINALYDEFEKMGHPFPKGARVDLSTEAEQLSLEIAQKKFNHEFMFVTGFPAKKRAFYHMRKNGIPEGFDLIYRGVEITTGAQREHRYEILKQQAEEKGLAKDVQFYLEFFKYGCPPHGGFGLGAGRLTMLVLKLPSLHETVFLTRTPSRLTP